MFILIAALMILFPTLNDPSGQLAVVSSMIPFTAPIIMPIRVAASDVPGTEIAMSIAITFVSALVVVWISARIYRIGILMYGKRPSMKEIVRWARQS
jgi:ABC-2 type transport system permease protein